MSRNAERTEGARRFIKGEPTFQDWVDNNTKIIDENAETGAGNWCGRDDTVPYPFNGMCTRPRGHVGPHVCFSGSGRFSTCVEIHVWFTR